MFTFLKKQFGLLSIGLVFFYLITHLSGLLELPVFADEAIYIRWSQLIIDDLPRYLFFPMNDGKTPLFFWIVAPFQFLFNNQLYAARFVSVIIGLLQIFVVMGITSLVTKSKKTVYLSGLLVTILPFWYFHHRMVLTDGLMTLMISISVYFLTKEFVSLKQRKLFEKESLINVLGAGLFFGFSLYSKIPAVLFIPALFFLPFLKKNKSTDNYFLSVVKVFFSISIGFFLFGLLALVPSFSQLFGRGSDFLFPLAEVLGGKWKETIPSFPTYIGYFVSYMTPTFIMFILMGLFAKKNKRLVHVFFWSALAFIIPIGVMGRMVYARYLFPAVLPLTLAGVFAIEDFFIWAEQMSKSFLWKSLFLGFLVLLLANTIGNSSIFMISSITNSSQVPFVESDKVQYLTEWSSGHGLMEVVELIQTEAQTKKIAVATEGSFGSLPDGLNLYFHNRNVENIAIDGVGYPVVGIPQKFAESARMFDEQWLVVNSHRLDNLKVELDKSLLIAEYCRPFNGPCLQVWNITSVFEDLVLD